MKGKGLQAMYQVPDEIVAHFSLEKISESEFDKIFPDSVDENR